jgi:hypothetical protein
VESAAAGGEGAGGNIFEARMPRLSEGGGVATGRSHHEEGNCIITFAIWSVGRFIVQTE